MREPRAAKRGVGGKTYSAATDIAFLLLPKLLATLLICSKTTKG